MKASNSRYNGITLIEILIYMALFAAVFSLVVGLLVQMREQNRIARDSIKIEQNMMLIDEHINTVIGDTLTVDELASIFDNDNGTLAVTLEDASQVEYERVGSELRYVTATASVPITNQSVVVTKFRVERVLDAESNLIGARVSCTITSTHESDLSKSWENFYYIQ